MSAGGYDHTGEVIRAARVARGWTQLMLAEKIHWSPATVSRWETGTQRLTDVEVLRQVADELRIPYEDLGLAATVSGGSTAEDDPVRRRQLLRNLTITAAAVATPGAASVALGGNAAEAGAATSGRAMVAGLRDALLMPRPTAFVADASELARCLAAARQAFMQCQYERLASELPRLINGGQALAASGDEKATAVLSEIYTLATRMLVKMDSVELGLVAADRARLTAQGSTDPLLSAEAARNLAVLTRKAGWHDEATRIALGAADDPQLAGSDSHLKAQRGLLIMCAAYTAAKTQDRSGMRDLTAHAQSLATGLGKGVQLSHGTGFGAWMVGSHLISGHNACGDPYAALRVARRLDPRALPTIERRSRYYSDVATSWALVGRRTECLDALLAAERLAPEETHARPAIHKLVKGLLTSGRVTPDLRGLAARCGLT